MAQYSAERKQAILNKLLSPDLISIAKLARDENIAEQTLYNWRHQAKRQGKAVPTNHKTKELSPETKLTIIIDTARLNELSLPNTVAAKGSTLNKSPNGKHRPSQALAQANNKPA